MINQLFLGHFSLASLQIRTFHSIKPNTEQKEGKDGLILSCFLFNGWGKLRTEIHYHRQIYQEALYTKTSCSMSRVILQRILVGASP